MNRKPHHIVSFILTIPFVIYTAIKEISIFPSIDYFKYLMAYFIYWKLFSMTPDDDKKDGASHRNFFYHSLILASAFTWVSWGPPVTSFAIFIVSIHLLMDVKENMNGFALITIFGKRLKEPISKFLLLVQGILGIIISILLEIYR